MLALILLPLAASEAQVTDLRLPISVDADYTVVDGKNSMVTFRGLRVTQGSISIVADEGRASKIDFEDSVWHFSGNVTIDTENGHIDCDTADLNFAGHQLRTAAITGSPATFELKRPESDQVTYAEAGRLEYDFSDGIIEFSEQATITEGGNQISSNYLLYDIREQRISARSAGQDDEKVRIIYTPGTMDDDAEDQAEPPEDGDGSGNGGATRTPEGDDASAPGAGGDGDGDGPP